MVISTGTLLTVIFLIMLAGVLPTWLQSRLGGYGLSGLLSSVLVVFTILMLVGRL